LIEVIDHACEAVLMFIGVGVDPAVGQICEALSRAWQLFKMFTCAVGLNERRTQAVAKLDQPRNDIAVTPNEPLHSLLRRCFDTSKGFNNAGLVFPDLFNKGLGCLLEPTDALVIG
jgi:hypothetical protein